MLKLTKTVQYPKLKSLQVVSIIILLWGLSDAFISFYLPIQLQTHLNNIVLFGFIFGISSLAGMLADPLLALASNRSSYMTLLLFGLLLSLVVVSIAPYAITLVMIILMLVAWGLYYEYIEIALFSYVSRYHNKQEQSNNFGYVYVCMNIAYVIGPLVCGYLVLYGSTAIYGVCSVLLILALACLPKLISFHKHRELQLIGLASDHEKIGFRRQIQSFKKAWRYASVFLIAAMLYNVWDSFIWTLVPIQSIGGNVLFAGLITSIFTIPLALFQGIGGKWADSVGRNIIFIAGLFIASLFTLLYGMQSTLLLKLITAFMAALGFAFAYPAMMGVTSSQGQNHEHDLGAIAGAQRIFINGGFIIGPIIGSLLSRYIGIQASFMVLGALMLVCCIPIAGHLTRFHMKGRIHHTVTAEFDL